MSEKRLFRPIATAFAVALLAAGCGGGGGGGSSVVETEPPPGGVAPAAPMEVDLMGSMDLMAGTETIPAGESRTTGYTTVTCAADGDDCVLTVAQSGVTGQYSATSTGGTVTVAVMVPPVVVEPVPPVPVALALPADHTLLDDLAFGQSQVLELAPGTSETRGTVMFSCPAGGDPCVITITKSLDKVVAEYTGGAAAAVTTIVVYPDYGTDDAMLATFLGMVQDARYRSSG